VEVFRQTEVENLDTPLGIIVRHGHNVFGFEVPMDNPVTVRRGQGVGELGTSIEDFVRGEAGPSQLFAPCAAFHVLIDNKAPLALLDKIINSGDTWMAQGGSCAGFGRKRWRSSES